MKMIFVLFMKWSSLYGWTFSDEFLPESDKICQYFFISHTFLVKHYIFIDTFISVRSFIFIQFSILKVWFRFETLKEDNLRAEMSLITSSGSRAEQRVAAVIFTFLQTLQNV